ncbi:type IV pilus assembly protein PilM [Candidatus Parcubacteria bacterium]|nr:type IV pilus assembly protein PilM [Candidatus Parcubacteria bacterium]
MFITKHNIPPIGLDISDSSLKLAQLKSSGDSIKIQALGCKNLEKGIIDSGVIKQPEIVIKKINELISRPNFGSINTNEVVACLPKDKTFIKLINMDKTPNNLIDVMENEIEKHFPLSGKEMYFDWQIVKEYDQNYDVLIGAAPKNIVKQYIAILTKARLSVVALEIESAAISRTLLKEEARKYSGPLDKNYCIINIGAENSQMSIYSQGTIVMSVSIPISSRETTDEIAKTLEIKPEQAEKAKFICGLDKSMANGIVHDILLAMIENIISRIQIGLDFYYKHYSGRGNITKIILTGNGANVKNIDKIFSEKLSIPAEMGNIYTHLDESKEKLSKNFIVYDMIKPDDKKKNNEEKNASIQGNNELIYTTAIGLALRKIFIRLTA